MREPSRPCTKQRCETWHPRWDPVKTHDIWANCELIDALDGAVLWQTDLAQATDWQCPANEVIAGFTTELAKKFPYRG